MKRGKFKTSFFLIIYILFLVCGLVVFTPANCAEAQDFSNLLSNGSLEIGDSLPLNWTPNAWGNNQAVFSYSQEGLNGSKGIKIALTNFKDGDAKWYFDDVPVIPNSIYYFSEYFKSDSPTTLVARFTSITGVVSYHELEVFSSSTEWLSYGTEITPPPGSARLTIFHTLAQNGNLWQDQLSLQKFEGYSGAGNFDQGYVSISFDDGWSDNFELVDAVLAEAQVPASFYVITQGLKPLSPIKYPWLRIPYVQMLNHKIHNCKATLSQYMDAKQILKLQKNGHEIGSHTVSHPNMPLLSTENITSELINSKLTLQQIGVKQVTGFAYPYGATNPQVMQAVKDAGYIGARGTQTGYNHTNSLRYNLKAQTITQDTSLTEIKAWVEYAKSHHVWVNLVFHQIDDRFEKYSIVPEKFEQIINYLQGSGVKIITMEEGLELLQ